MKDLEKMSEQNLENISGGDSSAAALIDVDDGYYDHYTLRVNQEEFTALKNANYIVNGKIDTNKLQEVIEFLEKSGFEGDWYIDERQVPFNSNDPMKINITKNAWWR